MSAPENGAHQSAFASCRGISCLGKGATSLLRSATDKHYTDAIVPVPPQTAVILELFDGKHSLLDIQEAFARRFGVLLFQEQLLQVIQSLDDCLLLDSPRFARHRETVEDDFRHAPHRPARMAGMSYPAEPDALRRDLDGYFGADDGPQDTRPSQSAGRLGGLVLPHSTFPGVARAMPGGTGS